MAKRKLKKWVKTSLVLGGMAVFGTTAIAFDTSDNEGALAKEVKEEVQELSYMEKLEMNEAFSTIAESENSYQYEAFFLYNDKRKYVYYDKKSEKEIVVSSDVVKKSYADMLQVGESVILHGDVDNINHVEVTGGRSVSINMLEYVGYSEKFNSMVYKDDNGETYYVSNDMQEKFGVDSDDNLGSLSTGYLYENKIVGITKGW